MSRYFTILLIFQYFLSIAQKPGDIIFNSNQIHYINIDFYQSDYWKQLTENYHLPSEDIEYIYIPAKITFNNKTLDSIGVRLKGQSSYEHKGMKKPIKLDFDRFVSGQKIDGLKKLNLNNGFMDPSMMREKLMLDFLNKKNILSPRCTYAAVYFNGSYIGLYKIVEEIDKTYLNNTFGNNSGNLYKGDPKGNLEWKGEAQWNYYKDYDLKTNETENNWTSLVLFIEKINKSGLGSFKSTTEEIFNSSQFIRSWAANNLFVNMDSYFFLPHNYFLYHNPNNQKFEWITWDVNLAFGVFPLVGEKYAEKLDLLHIPVARQRRPLTVKMLETEDYKKEYLNAVCEFLYQDFKEEVLFPKIDSLKEKIAPWINQEQTSNQMFSYDEFVGNCDYTKVDKPLYDVPGLKSFITKRRENVISQLCKLNWSCTSGNEVSVQMSNNLILFPNPSTQKTNIAINNLEPEIKYLEYTVYNLIGEIIWQKNIEKDIIVELNSLSLNQGIYIVSAKAGCNLYTQKLVIISE